jgi:hypothetical protein
VWIEMRVARRDPQAFALAMAGFARLGCPLRVEAVRGEPHKWLHAEVANRREDLDAALGVLQGVSELQLSRIAMGGGIAPPLYESGIRYEREPLGREWWQTAADNFAEGEGDCEDLASHRAAELVVFSGEPARAVTMRTGRRTFHAVVRRGDGSIEDPSAALGMRPLRRRA